MEILEKVPLIQYLTLFKKNIYISNMKTNKYDTRKQEEGIATGGLQCSRWKQGPLGWAGQEAARLGFYLKLPGQLSGEEHMDQDKEWFPDGAATVVGAPQQSSQGGGSFKKFSRRRSRFLASLRTFFSVLPLEGQAQGTTCISSYPL